MDPRVLRTRARLHDVVLALAAERPVTDLSVTEVADAAGVHRSTFYEHAASPVELLRQALVAELDPLRDGVLVDAATDPARAVTAVTEAVARHVERHAAIYRRGFSPEGSTAGLQSMLAEHFLTTSRQLRERAGVDVDLRVPGIDRDAVVEAAHRFVAQGTVGVLEAWLAQPDPSVAGFMAVYVSLVPDWWPRDLSVLGRP